jgi:quercetin dioxygenase-like cupin family protein
MRYVYSAKELPFAEFGEGVKRRVRLVFSPDIGNSEAVNIVTCEVPPGAVSEGHVHPDSDEIIRFSIAGRAVIDGREYEVPPGGFLFAPRGSKHECVNTSPGETLDLLCVFYPAFAPYGKYPELIEETKRYLGGE